MQCIVKYIRFVACWYADPKSPPAAGTSGGCPWAYLAQYGPPYSELGTVLGPKTAKDFIFAFNFGGEPLFERDMTPKRRKIAPK